MTTSTTGLTPTLRSALLDLAEAASGDYEHVGLRLVEHAAALGAGPELVFTLYAFAARVEGESSLVGALNRVHDARWDLYERIPADHDDNGRPLCNPADGHCPDCHDIAVMVLDEAVDLLAWNLGDAAIRDAQDAERALAVQAVAA